MSWKIINQILGLAAANPQFWQELQKDPTGAVQRHGFTLTAEERDAFCKVNTENLVVFSQSLFDLLGSSDEDTMRETFI